MKKDINQLDPKEFILIKGAKLLVYPGAPHGLADTHKERLNQDLLEFLKQK